MSTLHRSLLLPGPIPAGDGRSCSTVCFRPWLRTLHSGRKGASLSSAVLQVAMNLAFLLLLLVLLQNRSKHYFGHQYRQPAALRQKLALVTETESDVDATWLPPAWIGTPPPLDPLACTPQLLVIGGMKCGTSALFHYLNGTVPRARKAAKQLSAEWQPPEFGNDQQFLNGTPASIEYCNRFFSLPDEQRRFHPGVIGSIVTKEVHFFDQPPRFVRTHVNEYLAKFSGVDMSSDDPMAGKCSYPASLGLNSRSKPAMVRMEATVMYMPTKTAAGLVQQLLPEARLVALLREPTSRALSSINMVIQRGDFKELEGLEKNTPLYSSTWREVVVRELRKEMQQVNSCFEQASAGTAASTAAAAAGAAAWPSLGRSVVEQIDDCMLAGELKLSERILDIHLGLYALHLERWFMHFKPQQLLIWSTKAFKENPWHHMQQLAEWLGLDPALSKKRGDFLKMHKRTYPDGSLPKGFLAEIAAFYEPHNQRLFALLERQGYTEAAMQLRKAWPLELASTIERLEAAE